MSARNYKLHFVRGYWKQDGTYVRPHFARNPGRGSASEESFVYEGKGRLKKRHKAIIITVTVAGLGTAGVAIADLPWGGDAPSASTGTIDPASAENSTEINLRLDRTEATLSANGYGGTLNLRFDQSCAKNSYGQVHEFFISDSCNWLARAALTVNFSGHPVALVAISWVDMPNAAQANQYKHQVDAPGTGDVTELTRIEGPYKTVRYSGKYYVSGQYGTAVWNAEVQPISQLPKSVTEKILISSRQ